MTWLGRPAIREYSAIGTSLQTPNSPAAPKVQPLCTWRYKRSVSTVLRMAALDDPSITFIGFDRMMAHLQDENSTRSALPKRGPMQLSFGTIRYK